MLNGPILLVILFVAILFIVIATSKFKWHPFLALLIAAYGIGISVHMPLLNISKTVSNGFGGILSGIGLIIITGTIIGIILEKSGGAVTMAESVLKLVGEKRPALAMGLIGYIVSIPVFCDSGFVILNSLKNGMAKKTGVSVLTLSVALATGLYATHTFVPPTPGPIAAAGTLGMGDKLGYVMMFGLVVAFVTVVSLFFMYSLAYTANNSLSSFVLLLFYPFSNSFAGILQNRYYHSGHHTGGIANLRLFSSRKKP